MISRRRNKDVVPVPEYSNISIKNPRLPIDFLTNSEHKADKSGLFGILNEAVPINKVAQKGDQHRVDFLSLQQAELRRYKLHHFMFHVSGGLDTWLYKTAVTTRCKSADCTMCLDFAVLVINELG